MFDHSIWYYLFYALASGARPLIDLFAPANTANDASLLLRSLPYPVVSTVLGFLSFLGLFLDVPVLLVSFACILTWRAAWALINLVRIVLEFIPFF